MNKETLVKVEHISRYYGDHCAVDDLSFSVSRGEVLGFLGPNGAGKSTSMQIICGVLAASDGNVSVAGHDIIDEAKLAKQHIGFLPEQPPLYTDLTVDEYLKYCGRLRKISSNNITSSLANCKERCGLNDAGGRLISNLSKGFQQRVGIAQAIIHSPSVVILDEPTSGLDPIQIVEIRSLISELSEDHSVILSTHILSEVQSSCDRVLIINRGKLVLDESMLSLQGDSKHSCCIVALQKPPLLEELEKTDGVTHIDVIDQYRFRITYLQDICTPAILANTASTADWGLFELIPEHDSLEQTFMRLTLDDLNHVQQSTLSS
ncbi:MAG: ATP-binding cassette domain-containing protein [Gammaproteobacteria bacterium]|nr:ATP-binding cassette domain-containing protein [Gammaproteobacteria bacterium]